jgi:hypothetical protein
MSEFKDGIPVTKSYGQMLTELHEATLSQLSLDQSKTMDISTVFSYLKFLRKMRPKESGLVFIDELNLKICTNP